MYKKRNSTSSFWKTCVFRMNNNRWQLNASNTETKMSSSSVKRRINFCAPSVSLGTKTIIQVSKSVKLIEFCSSINIFMGSRILLSKKCPKSKLTSKIISIIKNKLIQNKSKKTSSLWYQFYQNRLSKMKTTKRWLFNLLMHYRISSQKFWRTQ